jgi:hypothetical protein
VRLAVYETDRELVEDLRAFFEDTAPFTSWAGQHYDADAVQELLAPLCLLCLYRSVELFQNALNVLNRHRSWGIYCDRRGYYPFAPEALCIVPSTSEADAPVPATAAVETSLTNAARLLPGFVETDYGLQLAETGEPGPVVPSWENYHKFMYHSEYQLAMDMLAGMSPRATSDPQFVVHLEVAAECMGLGDPWADVGDYATGETE